MNYSLQKYIIILNLPIIFTFFTKRQKKCNYSAPPNNSTQNITKRVAYGEKSCYGSEKRFSAAATNISSGRYECFQRPLRMFPAAATNREGSAFIPRRFGLHPAKVRPSSLSHGAYPFAMTVCGLAACLGSFQMTEQILSVSRQWVLNSNHGGCES